jgi:phage terminase large subunit-like protein
VIAYPNGSKCWLVGCPTEKDTDRLRALTNIDVDVFEEFFAIPVAHACFTQAQLSRRRGSRRFLISSTPRPHPLLKEWKDNPRIVITRATSMDNKHIPLDWLATLQKTYKGSRLYRQEVLGEILEDVEGALWTAMDIERSRVSGKPSEVAMICDRIVVGVDPPTGKGTCGIVVVGQGMDNGHLYVLDDRSVDEASPQTWAARVADAAETYDAVVVAEVNQGGQMVKEVLNASGSVLAIETVTATKSKRTRAEPIALLWEVEEQVVHMVSQSVPLIDQMCDWVPSASKTNSPDRVDALVWACWFLRSRNTATVRGHHSTGSGPIGLSGGLRSMRMGRY